MIRDVAAFPHVQFAQEAASRGDRFGRRIENLLRLHKRKRQDGRIQQLLEGRIVHLVLLHEEGQQPLNELLWEAALRQLGQVIHILCACRDTQIGKRLNRRDPLVLPRGFFLRFLHILRS